MKDTHEANLPTEENGKLEETKAPETTPENTAEEVVTNETTDAEVAAEETSEAEVKTDEVAAGEETVATTGKLSKEEILAKLKEIAEDAENADKQEIDSLKQNFYKLHKAAQEAAKKGIRVFVLGVGSPDGAPIPIEGTNEYRKDNSGNVIVTRLNEQMCQEIAKAGDGMYIRVDNTNSAQRALNSEINKMAKTDVESKVYTEFNEQFQAIAWLILILLLVEMLILERKNPLFKNIKLFH